MLNAENSVKLMLQKLTISWATDNHDESSALALAGGGGDASNISRAAETTGMTQSGASQAIAQLESSLGFPVFVRERRHIGVTALGEQVIEHARIMLSQLNAIRVLADESRV